MSTNKVINAVIALIEDRPQHAREMLRSPEMNIPVGELQTRLSTAIRNRETEAQIRVLKRILNTTLRITGANQTEEPAKFDEDEVFLMGVSEVERIIDNVISELEA